MPTATLTSKGQTTVPKAVRDHLGLASGDRLSFSIEPDGRVVVEAVTVRLRDLAGFLPKPARPLSLEEIDAAIQDHAVERSARSLAAQAHDGRRRATRRHP